MVSERLCSIHPVQGISFGIPSHTDESAGHLERLGRIICQFSKMLVKFSTFSENLGFRSQNLVSEQLCSIHPVLGISFGITSHTDESAGHLERLGRRICQFSKILVKFTNVY